MKTTINNRQVWLDIATRFVLKNPLLSDDELVTEYAKEILEIKKNKCPRNITKGSKKYNKAVVDATERALAGLALYYHINKLPTKIGFFYIIGCDSYPNWYKLGYSKDAEHRLNSYQTYSPNRDFYLERYIAVRDAKKAEAAAIQYLCNSIRNEWFFSENIKEDSKNIMKAIAIHTGFPNRFYSTLP